MVGFFGSGGRRGGPWWQEREEARHRFCGLGEFGPTKPFFEGAGAGAGEHIAWMMLVGASFHHEFFIGSTSRDL